jgi:glycosyltransferase involved in cell wall biosynthesis
MKILHLNTYSQGGAASAAYRMHQNLMKKGHDSHLFVLYGKNSLNLTAITTNSFLFRSDKRIRKIIGSLSNIRTNPDYCFFQNQHNSFVKTSDDIIKKFPFHPDIIVAHWISNFISIDVLHNLNKKLGIPIIWHMLDMAPLTGGCHYAWDCMGYTRNCGRCPAIYSEQENDFSFNKLMLKCNLIKDMNLTFVAASYWLQQQSINASITQGKKVDKILLAVDPDMFKPSSRIAARNALGLPLEKNIIFFAVHSFKERRKGMKYLADMITLFSKNYPSEFESCLFVGAGDKTGAELLKIMPNFFYLGYLKNDEKLAKAYQAADVFLCPSIEDSGPMMINEAMMTGVPVVAFNMGVAPDLIHEGKTGFIAETGNAESLLRGIISILSLGEREKAILSEGCRNTAFKLCHPLAQARSFENIFESLLKNTEH